MGVEEDRQPDDEPDVARAEHEDARRRQQVDGARSWRTARGTISTPSPCRASRGRLSSTPARIDRQHRRPSATARRGSRRSSSSSPPTKKPKPFIAFFEPVNHATQRNSWPGAAAEVALIADFEAVLVMSLATPAMPCAVDDPGDREGRAPRRIERRQHQQADDLQRQPDRQHARDAEARRQPAAAEIGEDPGRLVEQEQEGQQ